MKEPSSQKPSEPEGEGRKPENGERKKKPQAKLKLKPLVPTDQETGDTAENSSKSSLDKNQARLKLKHLMSPLSPHLQKVREADRDTNRYKPTIKPPSAVPIDEPGVDEMPPDEKPEDPSAQPPVHPAGPPAGTGPPPAEPGVQGIQPPVEAQPVSPNPETVETEQPEKTAGEEVERTEELVSAPKKKSRLLKVAIFAVNILIVLTAVQYFFDPLGLQIEPFEHPAPVLPEGEPEQPVVDPIANAIAPIESFADLESISMETFVGQLGEAKIIASDSPKGVIINSIFYPVGSTLHPQLKVTVASVETEGSRSTVKVVDDEGNQYEYPAN